MIEPVVEAIDQLELIGPPILAESELMSPFVWRLDHKRFAVLVRVVPSPDSGDACTGRIWYGESPDGLRFQMEDEPVLVPTLGGPDAGGCEDPTLVQIDDQVVVYYSGVDADGVGSLLWANGPDAQHLEKQGIALRGFEGEENAKEAEIGYWGDCWSLTYEFARDGASIIGLAESDGPVGPWHKHPVELTGREGKWDSWHVSTGPLVPDCFGRRVLFYNGATHDAIWGIGWCTFDPDRHEVIARSDGPLIAPPGEVDGRNMAFSSSCVVLDDRLHLYFSINDRECRRAVVRWPAEPAA